jgi:hypothetical protein
MALMTDKLSKHRGSGPRSKVRWSQTIGRGGGGGRVCGIRRRLLQSWRLVAQPEFLLGAEYNHVSHELIAVNVGHRLFYSRVSRGRR